jgi:hypothetical protein
MSSSNTGRGSRRNLQEARELVLAWRSSGMNKESWCRRQGILRSALHSCLTRVDQADGISTTRVTSGFLKVCPPGPLDPFTEGLRIELGSGLRVLGLELGDVVSVLRALREGGA